MVILKCNKNKNKIFPYGWYAFTYMVAMVAMVAWFRMLRICLQSTYRYAQIGVVMWEFVRLLNNCIIHTSPGAFIRRKCELVITIRVSMNEWRSLPRYLDCLECNFLAHTTGTPTRIHLVSKSYVSSTLQGFILD